MKQALLLVKAPPRVWLAILYFVIASLGLAACSRAERTITLSLPPSQPPPESTLELVTPTAAPTQLPAVTELSVQLISLPEPYSNALAQYSGMAWYGDWLVLLPQYPAYFRSQGSPSLVAIPKADLEAVVEGISTNPLEPHLILLEDQGLMSQIRGFEGFECITFDHDNVYLSIEAQPAKMLGYLVKGSVRADASGLPLTIQLEPASLVEIQPQAPLDNFADEACLVYNEQVFSLYEANGANVNPAPVAHIFDLDLQSQGSLAFPNIEYRITDATQPDAQGRFWAINYLFPGDLDKLKPLETNGLDALAAQYGVGATHAAYAVVERLVQYQISEDSIQQVAVPPLQLSLVSNVTARNWEGIVRFDERGFLLVTDSFPGTLLGFLAYP